MATVSYKKYANLYGPVGPQGPQGEAGPVGPSISTHLASYKTKISGSSGGSGYLSGSFFTTPSDKGYFVPISCVYLHESGSTSAATISVGFDGTTLNELFSENSITFSSVQTGSYADISLRSGGGIAEAAPPSTNVKWRFAPGSGYIATGSLCVFGYYSEA